MAKKGGSGKHYTSKGERPSVNKKIRNLVKAWKRQNPQPEDLLKREMRRAEIIRQPRTDHERKLRDRYVEEDRCEHECWKLVQKFASKKLTRARAMQAIKTSKVDELVRSLGGSPEEREKTKEEA